MRSRDNSHHPCRSEEHVDSQDKEEQVRKRGETQQRINNRAMHRLEKNHSLGRSSRLRTSRGGPREAAHPFRPEKQRLVSGAPDDSSCSLMSAVGFENFTLEPRYLLQCSLSTLLSIVFRSGPCGCEGGRNRAVGRISAVWHPRRTP